MKYEIKINVDGSKVEINDSEFQPVACEEVMYEQIYKKFGYVSSIVQGMYWLGARHAIVYDSSLELEKESSVRKLQNIAGIAGGIVSYCNRRRESDRNFVSFNSTAIESRLIQSVYDNMADLDHDAVLLNALIHVGMVITSDMKFRSKDVERYVLSVCDEQSCGQDAAILLSLCNN